MADRAKLEAMLSANPDDLFLKYALAMACASDGADDESLQRFALINSQHPDDVAAWFQHGQLLYRRGECDQARDVLTDGIQAARRVGDDHAEAEMQGLLDLL